MSFYILELLKLGTRHLRGEDILLHVFLLSGNMHSYKMPIFLILSYFYVMYYLGQRYSKHANHVSHIPDSA